MSVMSNFESKVEGAVDGAASALFSSPIEPAQIAKKAEKQMKKEKLVGSGRQYAPTLYNVLVNERDDKRLFGFYPTMASEIENYLYAKGTDAGMEFDARPLVRFIPDHGLKKGRFDVIAEVVAAPTIKKLRAEEQEYYGLAPEKALPAGDLAGLVGAGGGAGLAGAGSVAGARASLHNPEDIPGGKRRSSYSAQPASGKFAGLDVPAHIDDAPLHSVLPSRLEAQGVLGSLPNVAPVAPSPLPAQAQAPVIEAVSHNAAAVPSQQARTPQYLEQAADVVLGSAALFDSSQQRQYPLAKRKLTIGRGKENDIVIADANASRIHARFSQDATGKWKLSDLDSTNGTQLNGRLMSSAILRSGDDITIGTTVLRFTS